MSNSAREVQFGEGRSFAFDLPAERLFARHLAPEAIEDVAAAVSAALSDPIDFPGLDRTVFPGDRVVLVLDRDTPQAPEVIAGIWNVFESSGIDPADLTILQAADAAGLPVPDPRRGLPDEVGERIARVIHDPSDQSACAYLASTASGERLYLSRVVTEADVVICIGPLAFDPVLGYRGTASGIYPALARTEDIRRAHGQGHDELTHEETRPLRQTVDEVAWLLGLQFVIQVVPGKADRLAAVLAGQVESVFRRGKRLLTEMWRLEVPARSELVVAAVEADASGHGWSQIAAALDAARRVVAKDGRVVLLTDVTEQPGAGVELIRHAHSPRDALQPIRRAGPPDLVAATQIAQALDWTNVYLLSRLDPMLVEDLYMLPLASLREAERVIQSDDSCVIIDSAHRVAAGVRHP